MRLGVIVCPQCKKAKSVDVTSKTTKCPHCGKLLHTEKLKIFYTTDSQQKAAAAIGQINAQMSGNIDRTKNFFSKKRT